MEIGERRIKERILHGFPATLQSDVMCVTSILPRILNCLCSGHHDGFVRQRALMKLAGKSNDFSIPYTIRLLGEYVVEIIEDLQKHIFSENIEKYVKFIRENPAYWIKTKHRVTSYWNAYYRYPQYPDYATPEYGSREEYIGQVIVDGLECRKVPK